MQSGNDQLRVLLAMPPFDGPRAFGENLGLSYVDAALRTCPQISARVENRLGTRAQSEILTAVREFQPHVVGLGLTSHQMLEPLDRLASSIKAVSACLIVIGGHYLMFRGQAIMSRISGLDVAVIGEGEETILELADAVLTGKPLNSVPGLLTRTVVGVQPTPSRRSVPNLDALSHPTREPGLEVYNVSASRGCYTTCSFCSVPQFNRALPGRPLRLRSVQSVAEELRMLRDMGARAISFVDDVFLLPGEKGRVRARAIADFAAQLDIKWAFSCRTPELTEDVVAYCRPRGLCNIGLGLESGSADVLSRFSKRASLEDSRRCIQLCRRYDVSIIPYFIMFEPDMTLNDVESSVAFLREFGLLWPSYASNYLDPYPGTPAFDRLRAESRLIEDGWSFRPVYKDDRVANLIETLVAPLRKAQTVEFALRRREFASDLENSSNSEMRSQVRIGFARLSILTADFFQSALAGTPSADAYLDGVRAIAREAVPELTCTF